MKLPMLALAGRSASPQRRPCQGFRWRPRVFAILVLLAAAHTAAPAEAQRAEALMARAQQSFKRAQFQRSIALLNKALKRTRDPQLRGEIHLQRGVSYAVLGESKRASRAFRRALQIAPAVELDPKLKPSVLALFHAARKETQGTLIVEARGQVAVYIDDETSPFPAPLTRRLPVGAHRIRVVAPGGNALHQDEVVIRWKKITRVKVEAPPPASAAPPQAPAPQAPAPITPPPQAPGPLPSSRRPRRSPSSMLKRPVT
jgi:hypothetical protein